jgi:hypothetical protein
LEKISHWQENLHGALATYRHIVEVGGWNLLDQVTHVARKKMK